MGEEFLVGVGVEVLGTDDEGHVVAYSRIEQDAAEDPFFGVRIMGRQAVENLRADPAGRVAGVDTFRGRHGDPSF